MATKRDRSIWSVFRLQGFRGRLLALIVFAGFVCICLNGVLFYAYVLDSYGVLLRHTTLPEEIVAERYAELYGFAYLLGALNLAVLAVVSVWAIFMTQRVSGPIYHLHQVIKAVQAGQLDRRVHLRKADELHDLADAFNDMLDQLIKRQ